MTSKERQSMKKNFIYCKSRFRTRISKFLLKNAFVKPTT